jgi:hypothetical protein
MKLFKKEYNENDSALEMIANSFIPYTGDKYLHSMALFDQNKKAQERKQETSNNLNTYSKMTYATVLAGKYLVEGTVLLTAAEILMR